MRELLHRLLEVKGGTMIRAAFLILLRINSYLSPLMGSLTGYAYGETYRYWDTGFKIRLALIGFVVGLVGYIFWEGFRQLAKSIWETEGKLEGLDGGLAALMQTAHTKLDALTEHAGIPEDKALRKSASMGRRAPM
jgi:hypothetical protein